MFKRTMKKRTKGYIDFMIIKVQIFQFLNSVTSTVFQAFGLLLYVGNEALATQNQ